MKNTRSGFTLIETVIAAVILTTAIAVSTQMLIATSKQHKTMEIGRIALIEAGNVIERLAVQPWSKLDAKELSAWKLSPQATSALPGGKLEIQIEPTVAKPASKDPTAKDPAARRLTVIISYTPQEKQPARSVRLVTWRYDNAVAKPQPEAKNEDK